MILLAMVAAPMFTACKSGGWSDKEKETLTNSCMEGFNEGIQGQLDIPSEKLNPLSRKVCECGVEKAMEKFPKTKDMKSKSDFEDLLAKCVDELKVTDELVKIMEEQNGE